MATAAVAEPPAADTAVLQEKAAVPRETVTGPLQTPIAAPTESSRPAARPALSDTQKVKYDWLLQQARAWTEIRSDKGKGGPITDDERMWLSQECLLRYLRATKWHEKDAAKRLQETLTWRRDYGVEELTAEHISPENETGKQIILGYDKQGRVCHYLNPGRQNTDPSPRQVQHLVFMVERVIDIMPPQQETLALLINFKQSKNRSNTAPGIGQGREVLNILQTHYPERLGKALIINGRLTESTFALAGRYVGDADGCARTVPWVVQGFFKLITPFIDPHTREKLKFNEDMNQYVPPEHLWTEFNGKLEFEYDHSIYWPAMLKLAGERREARKARWVAGGKQIGELEDYLSGALEQGITPPIEEASASKAAGAVAEESQEMGASAEAQKPAETSTEAPSAGEPQAKEAAVEDLKVGELNLEGKGESK